MPKLTLRDLLAVVTIVALALGWWLDRSRLAREIQQLEFRERAARFEQIGTGERRSPFGPGGFADAIRDQPSPSN